MTYEKGVVSQDGWGFSYSSFVLGCSSPVLSVTPLAKTHATIFKETE